jgi:hypothetical protein
MPKQDEDWVLWEDIPDIIAVYEYFEENYKGKPENKARAEISYMTEAFGSGWRQLLEIAYRDNPSPKMQYKAFMKRHPLYKPKASILKWLAGSRKLTGGRDISRQMEEIIRRREERREQGRIDAQRREEEDRIRRAITEAYRYLDTIMLINFHRRSNINLELDDQLNQLRDNMLRAEFFTPENDYDWAIFGDYLINNNGSADISPNVDPATAEVIRRALRKIHTIAEHVTRVLDDHIVANRAVGRGIRRHPEKQFLFKYHRII